MCLSPGIAFSERYSYCKNLADNSPEEEAAIRAAAAEDSYFDGDCVMSLGNVHLILLLQAVVYLILGLYLDNVIPNEKGVRRQPWCAEGYYLVDLGVFCFLTMQWFKDGRGAIG